MSKNRRRIQVKYEGGYDYGVTGTPFRRQALKSVKMSAYEQARFGKHAERRGCLSWLVFFHALAIIGTLLVLAL